MRHKTICLLFVFIISLFYLNNNIQKIYSGELYDANKAIEYANNYHNKPCSDNFDFRDYGVGDCAHYVSCCIGNEKNYPGGGLNLGVHYSDLFKSNYYGIPGAAYPNNGQEGKDRITKYVDNSYWGWQLITSLESKNYIEERSSVDDLKPGDIIQYSITNGWCEKSGIKAIDSSDSTLNIGSIVKTNIAVYKIPGGTTPLSTDPKTGKIIDGPRSKNGKTWWQMRFDNGAQSHVVLYLGEIDKEKQAISDHLYNGGSVHGLSYTTILKTYGYNEARYFSFKDSIRKNPGKGDDDTERQVGTILINASFSYDNLCAPYTLYRSKTENGQYVQVSSGKVCEYDSGKIYDANYYYKVVWGEVSGYTSCTEQKSYLSPRQTIDFYCTYQKIADKSKDKGTIRVKATIDNGSTVPYSLYRSKTENGQYDFVYFGAANGVDFGKDYDANYYYKVIWGEVSGYTNCTEQKSNLSPRQTIDFNCTYQKVEKENPPSKYEKGAWISIGPSVYYYDDACGSSRYLFDYENGYQIYEKKYCGEKWWYKTWMQDQDGDYDKFVWIRGIDINKQVNQPLGAIGSEHYFRKGANGYDNPCKKAVQTIQYDGNKFTIKDRIYRCNTWWYKVNVSVWNRDVWFMESDMI
jgi:hypothetical protein